MEENEIKTQIKMEENEIREEFLRMLLSGELWKNYASFYSEE